MTNRVHTFIQPMDPEDLPCAVWRGEIPVVVLTDDQPIGGGVEIHLGNHPAPIAYLLGLSEAARTLAHQIERGERR